MSTSVKIPVLNIYYLLCYAWNKLEERDIVDVTGVDSTNLYDLFAKVLVGGMNHLLKRGLDRGYISHSEDSKCLRGKINFGISLKRNLLMKAQIHCEYDELSHNILHNQIIKATCNSLIIIESLNTELKNNLIGLRRKLHSVEDIQLTSSTFSCVQLNTNNSFYGFLLKICELVYESMLVDDDPGESKFREFIQDDKKMAYLFEYFVRNFYKIELTDSKVYREDIRWDASARDGGTLGYLPKMSTDISIEREGEKIVIETKYYKKMLTSHYDIKKFIPDHLYQLSSYLQNLKAKGGINTNCSGILLYAKVDRDISEKYALLGHNLSVHTIDLNQDWKLIHGNLLNLVELNAS
jgi:5-methylcytosine-specific restriction enzyme subunit McrC